MSKDEFLPQVWSEDVILAITPLKAMTARMLGITITEYDAWIKDIADRCSECGRFYEERNTDGEE